MDTGDTLKSDAFKYAGQSMAKELRDMLLWSIRYDKRQAKRPPHGAHEESGG